MNPLFCHPRRFVARGFRASDIAVLMARFFRSAGNPIAADIKLLKSGAHPCRGVLVG